LQEFLRQQHAAHIDMLLRQIRQRERDTMKEAALAGKVDVFETLWMELEHFSKRALKEATQ